MDETNRERSLEIMPLTSRPSSNPDVQPQLNSFLGLPVEIRRHILSFLLPRDFLSVCSCLEYRTESPPCCIPRSISDSDRRLTFSDKLVIHAEDHGEPRVLNFHPAVLRSSRQLFREAKSLLKPSVLDSICACEFHCLVHFYQTLPMARRATIRRARFWKRTQEGRNNFSSSNAIASLGLSRVRPFVEVYVDNNIAESFHGPGLTNWNLVQVDISFEWTFTQKEFSQVVERIRLEWQGCKQSSTPSAGRAMTLIEKPPSIAKGTARMLLKFGTFGAAGASSPRCTGA